MIQHIAAKSSSDTIIPLCSHIAETSVLIIWASIPRLTLTSKFPFKQIWGFSATQTASICNSCFLMFASLEISWQNSISSSRNLEPGVLVSLSVCFNAFLLMKVGERGGLHFGLHAGWSCVKLFFSVLCSFAAVVSAHPIHSLDNPHHHFHSGNLASPTCNYLHHQANLWPVGTSVSHSDRANSTGEKNDPFSEVHHWQKEPWGTEPHMI